jgi:peptide deformylase
MASPYAIRIVGDPVLRQRSDEVTDIDARLVKLCEDMLETMYDAPGMGLAAPQVGVQKRFFVYDIGEGPDVLINPVVTGADGEWEYHEGCLSVPGMSFDIVRPKQIEVSGIDLDGNEVTFEADDVLARLVQHELDHLDGVLLLERLDEDQRREAKRAIRERVMSGGSLPGGGAEPDQQKRSPFRLR